MKSSIVDTLKESLKISKNEIKLNQFQLENLRIKNVYLKGANQEKILLEKNTKLFSEINKYFLENNGEIDFGVEIEIIPFGKLKFEKENTQIKKKNNTEMRKKRYIDLKGNIFFHLNGNNN